VSRLLLPFFSLCLLFAIVGCKTEGTTQTTEDGTEDTASRDVVGDSVENDDVTSEDSTNADSDPGDIQDSDEEPTEDTLDPPECSPAFAISPTDPGTGSLLNISYTDPQPLTYVGLSFVGPGQTQVGELSIDDSGADYTWSWPVTVDTPGRYTVTFTYDQPQKAGSSCEFDVADTGPPPDIDPSDPDGGTCVCGEGDCQTCPVVNSCFDDPSPYSPSGSGTWQCLDNAGCDGGSCRIWCPFEPCPRPDGQGCVNNTETCYVPPHITDYEEACRWCCEETAREAEWNAQDNYCMEPRPL
jgi:hypothetical protein